MVQQKLLLSHNLGQFSSRPFARHGELRMAKLSSFAVDRPKLINPRRKALAHHLPTHPPFRVGRHTGQAHRSSAPSAIDGVQNTHDLLRGNWLRYRKEVFGVLAFLAQVDQEYLGFAVPEPRTVHPIHGVHRSLYHQTHVVGWVPVRAVRPYTAAETDY